MDWVNPHYRSNGQFDGTNATLQEPISADGIPKLNVEYCIPARQARAAVIKRGQYLEVRNPYGTQVCDLWMFACEGMHEFLSMEHLRAFIDRTIPRVGDPLITNRRRAIASFVIDTSAGVHDTLIAACDLPRYRTLGVQSYHDNCSDNLRMALAAIGRYTGEVPAPFNVWMNNPVLADGAIEWKAPTSKAGDYVVFKAEMDCVAVMSACPQDITTVNGADRLPKKLTFTVSDQIENRH